MAKITKSISFKNATIDIKDRTISEFAKDDTRIFSIDKILNDWSNIDGLSITIKLDEDAPADGE